jgi:hypothetical protein
MMCHVETMLRMDLTFLLLLLTVTRHPFHCLLCGPTVCYVCCAGCDNLYYTSAQYTHLLSRCPGAPSHKGIHAVLDAGAVCVRCG